MNATVNESCGTCEGDLGPSNNFPWHFDNEDCRAIRQPIDAMRPGELHYETRDLGYGVESDVTYGWFTGEVDWVGKLTFQESSELANGGVLYLFPDEVVEFSV